MAEKGHWYTDKNGNHYFVKEGQTPKEGWEQSKRRKMIDGGEYKVDDGDGKGPRSVGKDEYDGYEADDADFDANTEDDFGFDEEEDNVAEDTEIDERKLNHVKEYFDIWGKPLESEWSEVIKHYDLNEKEAAELKKHFWPDEGGNGDQSEDDLPDPQSIWDTFDEWQRFAYAEDQNEENVNRGNELSEKWSADLDKYLTEEQRDEFFDVYDRANDPEEIESFMEKVIGKRNGKNPSEAADGDFTVRQGSQGTYEVFHKDRSGGPVAEFDSEDDAREQIGKWKADPEGFKREYGANGGGPSGKNDSPAPRKKLVKYYKPLSKAEAEEIKKSGFTEDEYRYRQAVEWAIMMDEEIPDKNQFMQELGELKETRRQKAEQMRLADDVNREYRDIPNEELGQIQKEKASRGQKASDLKDKIGKAKDLAGKGKMEDVLKIADGLSIEEQNELFKELLGFKRQ